MPKFSQQVQVITQSALDAGVITRVTKGSKVDWWNHFGSLLTIRLKRSSKTKKSKG